MFNRFVNGTVIQQSILALQNQAACRPGTLARNQIWAVHAGSWGYVTCQGNPGSWGYEQLDAVQCAEWGVVTGHGLPQDRLL